ncbi:efflux RND transporter periplasmic adaptor subunit [Mesorhizobium tamadayense]|uniref:Efflux RND transporter periplasmic adaptor subunit n=1 Tax=Mesorhizobium tamadayense TaxID=425306 RepID=A0A3P3F7B8_9HYPH|nr:efflux RND transporter periplasmic adaptor subunit [Mesorhizobium tamadayense]RRH94529.1 efflux RND transporter periplasmic adaptor subunit [Mesorhizobium tamadayense]
MRNKATYALMTVAALTLYAAYLSSFPSHSAKSAPPDEMTAIVTRGSVEEVVLAPGTLEPVSMVRVGAQVSGQIKAIHVRVGQTVMPGDLLAEIDAIPQQSALRIAKAKVEDMNAQKGMKQVAIRFAESDLRRQRSLSEHRAVSKKTFEEAEREYQTLSAEQISLEAKIQQSEVDVEIAQANLAYTRIISPMQGRIVAVPIEPGQTLNSTQTSPTVAVIANLDEMVVKIRISEVDVWRTRPGQNAWFTIFGDPQTRYQAPLEMVEYAPPSIAEDSSTEEASAVYYHGVLRVKNPEEKLRTKMTAQVRISIGRADDVLLVPWAALSQRQANGSYLVKVKGINGKVTERSVRTGYTDRTHAQVLEGLRQRETVLLDVYDQRARAE